MSAADFRAAPPAGGAARASGPLLDPATVRRLVLPNGLTVLLRRDDTAPVVAIVTFVKAGYFDETDDIVGIAHVLEHMFFKGTSARPVGAISKETKAAGGYLNAGTIYDHTSYYTVLPSASFARGLDIQRDAYADSVIDAEELAKELEVIIQEAKRKADNPSAVATETLFELLHDEHRIRRWRIGREEGLRELTRDDLVRFYRNFYRPSTTILSIVGAIDLDAAAREIERQYGSLVDAAIERHPGPDEPARRDFRYRELEGDITQTQLSFGWRTPDTRHPDTPLLELAGTMLGSGRGSRLYRAVRERKLATSVSAYDYTPTEVGVFVIHAEGPPEKTIDAARSVWAQLADVRANGFTGDELNRARQLLEARFVRRLETMEGQANFLAEWEALGDWQMGERELERLMTATAEEVTDAVRRYLGEDSAGVIVYRPRGAAPVADDARAMRALLAGEGATPLARVPAPARIAVLPIARASFEREEGRVRVYRTEQNVPILVLRRPGSPLVQLGIHVAGGATEERESLAGLTSMLTRTSVKGTRSRSAAQIAEDGELLGGSVSGSTAAESFSWGISVPARHAAAALELLSDVVQHATFEQQALETERTLAIADLEMLRDDMYRYPLRLLTAEAFAGHPYGVPASGTEESLGAINTSQVREWHHTQVLEGASVIGVVGDVDPDEIAMLVAARFSELRWRERAPLDAPAWPPPRIRVESRDKAQSALALAFASPSRSDDARIAAELLAGVASGLGGRFFDQLRDKQSLAYTVSAFTAEWRNAGMFISYIATSPEKEEIARAGLLAEFAKLREAPVTDAELAQAKEYAIGTHAIRSQSGGALLGELIDAWLFGRGLSEIDEHDARIRRVTSSDMQQLAIRYFDESALVQSVIRGTGRRV